MVESKAPTTAPIRGNLMRARGRRGCEHLLICRDNVGSPRGLHRGVGGGCGWRG